MTGAKDEPLAGVSLLVKGNNKSAITDNDGAFTLEFSTVPQTAIVSFVGYRSREVIISDNRRLNIRLEEDVKKLGGVTVRGFSSSNSRARRRVESVQTTPKSVVSFTREDISARVAQGLRRVDRFHSGLPGVFFVDNLGRVPSRPYGPRLCPQSSTGGIGISPCG